MTATKIQPGDDMHLTLLMSPHSLNFVTGADRAALLAYGRDVFAAARNSKCLAQIEEPAAPAAVAPRGEYPHEQMDAMALDRYKVVPSNASMLWSHAVVAGDGTQQLYVGREVECQNMARKFAGAFLDGAFAFHSTAAAPTAPAAPALEAPAAPVLHDIDAGIEVMAWLRENRAPHSIYCKMSACLFGDPDKRAALAAAPQAPAEAQEPAANLHDDGYWTPTKTEAGRALNERLMRAGSPRIPVYTHPAPQQAAPQAPAKGLPYEPTSDMLIAGRACDPALPVDTVRAIWWAMWRTAPQAPAAPVEDAGEPALGEWPRVSGVGRDAESPRTLLLYLQTEASDDELRAIHDALLDGGALATHALSELMHIGYRVEGGKLVPPEKLSDCASEFFGASALTAKATAAHSDDLAVDRFAAEMKSKLAAARAKGRGGWETCPPEVLSRMLREHTDKGDPRDVANFCMLLWCLDQPISEAAPAVDADGDSWYLQDTRSYVGNDVLWWAKDGKGYTTDVSKAHVFTREEAFSQAAMRVVDRAWPKAYIDGKTRPAVDMQYINHDQAIAAQAAAKGGGIVSKTERLGHANALIEIISRHGRRFFRNRESGAIARLELDASGRLWWIDEYRGSRVYTGKVMGYPHRWRGFSHGGTLRSLVEALRGYVLRGELLHPEYIAPSRIDPTNGDIWGYGAEAAAAVRAEAHALPLFQRPTGHKES